VAQAILVALGPIFILLFLFEQTRGLFIGWVRALTGAIIAPIASWGGLMICLSTLEPWIDKLAQERVAHAIKVETISSLTTFVLTFAGAQVVTALGAIVITTAFTLPRGAKGRDPEPARTSETQQTIVNAGASESRASVLAQSLHSERNPQHGVDGRRTEVFSGADAARAPDAGATVPRLGDSYRRLSPAGALSRAAAPSAGARG
jgi:type IV secretion system protein VirB6